MIGQTQSAEEDQHRFAFAKCMERMSGVRDRPFLSEHSIWFVLCIYFILPKCLTVKTIVTIRACSMISVCDVHLFYYIIEPWFALSLSPVIVAYLLHIYEKRQNAIQRTPLFSCGRFGCASHIWHTEHIHECLPLMDELVDFLISKIDNDK